MKNLKFSVEQLLDTDRNTQIKYSDLLAYSHQKGMKFVKQPGRSALVELLLHSDFPDYIPTATEPLQTEPLQTEPLQTEPQTDRTKGKKKTKTTEPLQTDTTTTTEPQTAKIKKIKNPTFQNYGKGEKKRISDLPVGTLFKADSGNHIYRVGEIVTEPPVTATEEEKGRFVPYIKIDKTTHNGSPHSASYYKLYGITGSVKNNKDLMVTTLILESSAK